MTPILLLSVLLACGEAPEPVPQAAEPAAPPTVVRPEGLPDGEDAGPAPTVQVYPSNPILPANRVRLQLAWSEPIKLAPHGLHVRDASGEVVRGAVPKMVWNDQRVIATIEPTGLKPGQDYTLRVEGFWTERGGELTPVEHVFRIGNTDLEPPDARKVRAESTMQEGTSDPLILTFPEPMDRSAPRGITVLADGRPWAGVWTVEPGETVFRFEPAEPWPAKGATVSLAAGITDIAGNEMANRQIGMITPTPPLPRGSGGVSMEGL